MKIKTHYVYPPIPIRNFDWSAVDDDTYDGPGSPIGYGRTEQDAIDDLLDQIAERKAKELAIGRLVGMMSRPFQEGDIQEYYRCRAIIMQDAEESRQPTIGVHRPGWNFGNSVVE